MTKTIVTPVLLEMADGTWIRTETTIGNKELQARVRHEVQLTMPEWRDLEAYWKHNGGQPLKSLFREEQERLAGLSRGSDH